MSKRCLISSQLRLELADCAGQHLQFLLPFCHLFRFARLLKHLQLVLWLDDFGVDRLNLVLFLRNQEAKHLLPTDRILPRLVDVLDSVDKLVSPILLWECVEDLLRTLKLLSTLWSSLHLLVTSCELLGIRCTLLQCKPELVEKVSFSLIRITTDMSLWRTLSHTFPLPSEQSLRSCSILFCLIIYYSIKSFLIFESICTVGCQNIFGKWYLALLLGWFWSLKTAIERLHLHWLVDFTHCRWYNCWQRGARLIHIPGLRCDLEGFCLLSVRFGFVIEGRLIVPQCLETRERIYVLKMLLCGLRILAVVGFRRRVRYGAEWCTEPGLVRILLLEGLLIVNAVEFRIWTLVLHCCHGSLLVFLMMDDSLLW